VLQCVACNGAERTFVCKDVRGSVLQCVTACCSVLQCIARDGAERTFTCMSVRGSVLQCVAVCCSVLQCIACDGAERAFSQRYPLIVLEIYDYQPKPPDFGVGVGCSFYQSCWLTQAYIAIYTGLHLNTSQYITIHRNIYSVMISCATGSKRTAKHCNTLQHTATHWNTLHHTATHGHALQHYGQQEANTQGFLVYVQVICASVVYVFCCSVLQCVSVCCSVLQCVAVCCSVLQCVAVCSSEIMRNRKQTHRAFLYMCR